MSWGRLLLLWLAVATPGRSEAQQALGESRIYVFDRGDSIRIAGWVRDMSSAEPLDGLVVAYGNVGTLVNREGWFALDVASAELPLDLKLEKVGWGTVVLRVTDGVETMRFFVQQLDLPLGCERLRVSGEADPTLNEVVLHLRDVATNESLSGPAAVQLRLVDIDEVTDTVLSIDGGALRLPVTRYGVYDVEVRVDGFAPLRIAPLAVNTDVCDPRGVRSTAQDAWLVPISR